MTRKKTTHNSVKDKSFGLTPPPPPYCKIVTTKVEKYNYTRHQLLVEELATASIYRNVPYKKSVLAITFYTKQTLLQSARIQKPKFSIVYTKQHLN